MTSAAIAARQAGRLSYLAAAATVSFLAMVGTSFAADDPARKPLEVANVSRPEPVDFNRDVLPFLQANCLPCHNKTTTKADLLLETPADMLRGGESGPALVPGKAAESLLFKLSTHAEKPRMPPKENKVNAVNLTPEELGLLALWINQGAHAPEHREEAIMWQPLAAGVKAIYAVAVTTDGQFAACGRGNQLTVYHLPTARPVAQLTDPALITNGLPPAAHRDLVNALAFSPDGRWLASGGFREIKLWSRPALELRATNGSFAPELPTNGAWHSPDGTRAVAIGTNGFAQLTNATNAPIAELKGDPHQRQRVAEAQRTRARARALLELQKPGLEAATKEVQAQQERLRKAQEAEATARRAFTEKDEVWAKAKQEFRNAEARKDVATRAAAGATNTPALKSADERLAATKTALDKAEGERKPAELKAATSENERTLAVEGVGRAEGNQARAAWLLREAGETLAAAETALKREEVSGTESERRIVAAAFSPDSRWVATADETGRVVTWAATNGIAAEAFVAAGGAVKALAFPTADELVVTTSQGSFVADLTPRWELAATLGPEGTGSRLADRVNALAFSPDGRRLASGGGEPSRGGEVWLWDVAGRTPLLGLTNLHSDAVLALAFSPDGRWLASGGADRFARVVEVASGRPARTFEGHTAHVLGVGWRADGRTLASAGADLQVKFWDFTSGERRKQATGFGHEVTAIAHLAGTDQWVAASGDAELRVINENGERVRGLVAPGDFTETLAVTPDGQTVVAGGQEGVLRVWAPAQEQPRLTFAPPASTAATVAK